MKGNMGGIERAWRFIIGIVAAPVGAFAHLGALWEAVFFAVAIVALTTAFTGV